MESEHSKNKFIFTNTENQKNAGVCEKILSVLKEIGNERDEFVCLMRSNYEASLKNCL